MVFSSRDDTTVRRPDFFIVGAMKSGTTSLYHYIKQHADIFMPTVKEPNYYSHDLITRFTGGPGHMPPVYSREEYLSLFRPARESRHVGEATANYLYSPTAASRIHGDNPDARIIMMLRNPADRAYSAYMHRVRDGYEKLPFPDALMAEEERIRDNWKTLWHYRAASMYHDQVARYLDLFGRDRVRVFIFEEFRDDPVSVCREVFRFLDVDDAFTPDTSVNHNMTGVARIQLFENMIFRKYPGKLTMKKIVPKSVRSYLKPLIRRHNLRRIPISQDVRRALIDEFRPEVERLQTLLERDLSIWLE